MDPGPPCGAFRNDEEENVAPINFATFSPQRRHIIHRHACRNVAVGPQHDDVVAVTRQTRVRRAEFGDIAAANDDARAEI